MQADPPTVQLKALSNGTAFYMSGDTAQTLYERTDTPIDSTGNCEVIGVVNGNKTSLGGTLPVIPAHVKVTPIL